MNLYLEHNSKYLNYLVSTFSIVILLIILIRGTVLDSMFACRIFIVLHYCHTQLLVTKGVGKGIGLVSSFCFLTKKLKPFGDLGKMQSLIKIKV